MRNSTASLPFALDEGLDDQIPLPFAEELPPPDTFVKTTRQVVNIGDRRGRAYELTVHQDRRSLMVLAYSLRPITRH